MRLEAVDLDEVCHAQGLQIEEAGPDFSRDLDSDGFNGVWTIRVSPGLAAADRRLAIARQLGQRIAGTTELDFKSERTANEYALCLLMPAEEIHRARELGLSVEATAELLCVPKSSLEWRMAALGL